MNIELIRKLVKASGVKEGELVLVHYWGEDANIEVMHNFSIAIAELGASPLMLQQSRLQNRKIFSVALESSFDDKYFSILEHVDAVLDIFTYQPVVLKYELPVEKLNLYRTYMGKLFNALMKVSRFTQIRIPTRDNAEESNLDSDDYMERMNNAYDIDYDRLRITCEETITELKKAKEIVLQTGDHCNLRFITKDREWIADCGDGDLPCGEVYIAPIEEETNGTVFFDKLYLDDVGVFDKVVLTVESGVVINSNNESVNGYILSLPKESRVVCELGFGLNEKVTSLCGYPLLDEKMNNTFHIAIGNNTMFGGNNNADLHLDLVGRGKVELF